tara:strand:+ start:193 stop:1005 length:813 start_codon:yes stop_codon:yes gene_type:complete
MPTADSFAALGKGNGFPFCLPVINVNDSPDGTPYEYWITLGGTKKGGDSPTQAEIDLSLANAMKLWWNYNGHTARLGQGDAPNTNYTDLTIDVDEEEYRLPSQGSLTKPFPFPAKPQSRACAGNGWTNSDGTRLLFWTVGNQISFFGLRTTMFIVKMYDGSTDDESNFLGYGANGQIQCSLFGDALRISSTFYENQPGINPIAGYDAVFKYITIEDCDIPIVACAFSASDGFDDLTISDDLTATWTRDVRYGTSKGMRTMQHKDFDFYTY